MSGRTYVMHIEHNLLDFWKKQKINISSHIKNGHTDYALILLSHMADAAWNDREIKSHAKNEMIAEIEQMVTMAQEILTL